MWAHNQESPKDTYTRLASEREPYLQRARTNSYLTLQHLYPPEGAQGAHQRETYQSVGAEALNHLSNRIVSTLFPVNHPFFALQLAPDIEDTLAGGGQDINKLRVRLAKVESQAFDVQKSIKGFRAKVVSAIRHVLAAGQVLIDLSDLDNVRVRGLNNFCTERSVSGEVLCVVTVEEVTPEELEKSILDSFKAKGGDYRTDGSGKKRRTLSLYTKLTLKLNESGEKVWDLEQCIEDIKIGESQQVAFEDNPFVVVHHNLTEGENFATGYVTDYAGDLAAINQMSWRRIKYIAGVLKTVNLVAPGFQTDLAALNEAESGDFVQGRKDDLEEFSAGDAKNLEPVEVMLGGYLQRVGRAFNMPSHARRDSERTTAEEVRQDAMELDTAHAGLYSQLSELLQLPVARALLKSVDPQYGGDLFSPNIITGLDSLGKAIELSKYDQYIRAMSASAGLPEGVLARLDIEAVDQMVRAALNMPDPLLIPEEKFQQQQQQAAQQEQQAMAAQEVVKGASRNIGNSPESQ